MINYIKENLYEIEKEDDIGRGEISSLGRLCRYYTTKEYLNILKGKRITNETLNNIPIVMYGISFYGKPPNVIIPFDKIKYDYQEVSIDNFKKQNDIDEFNKVLNKYSNKDIVDILLNEDKFFRIKKDFIIKNGCFFY